MITLSADFLAHVTAKDTRKLVVAHLYYDDTHFLPVATVATVVDGVQYYGILKDMGGSSHKWNIQDNNNVTVNTPKLTLIDYTTPTGFSIVTEFNTHTYYGRKLIVYYGFEGQTLDNMLKAFDGFIDEINYDNNKVIVTGKSFVIPPVDIGGSKIDYDNQKVGGVSIPSGTFINKANHNKVLPIPFGHHWCAPMQPTFYTEQGGGSYYSIFDESYSTLLVKDRKIRQDIWNRNIGSYGASILLQNDGAYTPLYLQGWSGDAEVTYTIYYNSVSGYPNGIKIAGTDSGNHGKTDDMIFITVPLIYKLRNDLSNWFLPYGTSAYDSETTLSKVFDTTDSTTAYTVTTSDSIDMDVWVKLTLDEKYNLRNDEQAFVREGRKISIPSIDSNNGGQGYLLGKFYCAAYVQDDAPITVAHWKDNYIPDYPASGLTDSRYIARGSFGKYNGQYFYSKYGARVLNKNYAHYAWDYNVYDEGFDAVGLQGDFELSPSMGNDPFILRSTLNEPVGAALNIHTTLNYSNDEVSIWKMWHMTAGEIDHPKDNRIYSSSYGIKLTADTSLNSTPQTGSPYILSRPYEYIEFLLKEKTINSSFSSDFNYSTINTNWESLFSSSRDDSGFVIDEATTLDKFIGEYIKTEPYTIYADESGSYQIKILKKTYVTGDKNGTLDYNDATDFSIYMTDSKNIKSEIKSLKTDYMYDLDNYVHDINWKIVSGLYDYSFWKYGNTFDDNEFFVENIDKKYTSYVNVDVVTYDGKEWGCKRTGVNNTPSEGIYWAQLTTTGIASTAWNSSTLYYGEDAEQYAIASWYLNMWGNRHRIIDFKTDNLSYLKYTIGDLIEFSNVPYSLVGMDIKGFNGATNFEATINGQTVYALFIITGIQKSLKSISITAMQLHKLDNYSIVRVN